MAKRKVTEEDLVPVIFMPEGAIEYHPRKSVEIVKLVRELDDDAKAKFDRMLVAISAGTWPYNAEQMKGWTREQAFAAVEALR